MLLKFFLNSNSTAYLRGLEAEFGDSTNAIRLELNRFEKAGMLESFQEGNKKFFKANTTHPLYTDIHHILLKYIGFDRIVDTILSNIGDIQKVYVTGSFAKGLDDEIIHIVLVGKVNISYLNTLIEKTKGIISRSISYEILSLEECNDKKTFFEQDAFLLWET
ncbi:MAG: ArsR family transcriptional regulator [Saprospiraceae bacterium]